MIELSVPTGLGTQLLLTKYVTLQQSLAFIKYRYAFLSSDTSFPFFLLTKKGLLYYWTKYIKQSVSLIINLDIENWGSRDGSAYMETKLIKGKRGILTNYSCVHTRGRVPSPYRDFWHFTGKQSYYAAMWQRIGDNISQCNR